MIAPIAFVFGLLSLVSAAPGRRDVSTCTIIKTGVLKADGHLIGISDDQTVSIGISSNQLVATFQSCQPNFGHYDGANNSPLEGHLVDTSTNKCLSLKPGFSNPPFTLTVEDCCFGDDDGSISQNFIKDVYNRIWFAGGTKKDHSSIWYQSQCLSGTFGIDRTTQKGPVGLKCTAFGNVESFELV